MLSRMLQILSGQHYTGYCTGCNWEIGREDLTKEQAMNRVENHQRNAHGGQIGTVYRLKNQWILQID